MNELKGVSPLCPVKISVTWKPNALGHLENFILKIYLIAFLHHAKPFRKQTHLELCLMSPGINRQEMDEYFGNFVPWKAIQSL